MHRYWTFLGTLLALILVSAPALAQDETDDPDGSVGSAPGEESRQKTSTPGDETSDQEPSETADADEEEASGADKMEGSRDGWDSDDSDETDEDDEVQNRDHPSTVNSFVLAPHAGAAFPAFDDLGFWGTFGLEVGVLPPLQQMKDRPLEVAVIARYSQPGATGSSSDPNLGQTGGDYNWNVTHQTLTFDGLALWRFRNLSDVLAPYVLGGLRLNLTQTSLSGGADESGAEFGELRETNTHLGFVAGVGTDFHLGPGTVFGELTFGWTSLDQDLTELGSTTALALDIGYRFFPF